MGRRLSVNDGVGMVITRSQLVSSPSLTRVSDHHHPTPTTKKAVHAVTELEDLFNGPASGCE